jgi:hypothetical protein
MVSLRNLLSFGLRRSSLLVLSRYCNKKAAKKVTFRSTTPVASSRANDDLARLLLSRAYPPRSLLPGLRGGLHWHRRSGSS